MPANLLPNLPIALRQSDLYFLEDSFAAHIILNDQNEIFQDDHNTNGEFNAVLVCFSRDLPLPLKIYLEFGSAGTKAPVWMFPTTNLWIMGGTDAEGKQGVWLLPVSKIGPAIAAQRQMQLDQLARERAVAEQRQENLLAKYDGNHDGVIDPDEKEVALDDPAFIELKFDEIDANNDGWLDAEDLVWFDANTNKTLEPKEQAGIEIAQHLLAERLLKKFDANADGLLDLSEFNHMSQLSPEVNIQSMSNTVFQFSDENHDGVVDLGELETFLKQQTNRGLVPRGMPRAIFLNQMRAAANQPGDARQLFKREVESYWQNPDGVPNQPPSNGRVSPGAGFVPSGTPQ
jgi:Ca2+-binding EF-hand superfamily protein